MYLKRAIRKDFISKLQTNKVSLLLGARRVGKTSFIKSIIEEFDQMYILLNGENSQTKEMLQEITTENYQSIIGFATLLIIDEAQKIPNIGNILKFIVDNIEGVKVIATGSSAFDLNNKLGEPLVGRKKTFYLYPFAQSEYDAIENRIETKSKLEERLIFGNYPELIHLKGRKDKEAYLIELTDDYLFRDILEFDGIKNADKLRNLLKLIAFQVGKEVSLNELSRNLGIHKDTVARYLDLLSKVFVIYKIPGFSKNLRKEVTKMDRWNFYDNGVRNAVVNNFSSLDYRADQGELWENYILSERIKFQKYNNVYSNNYFWRTYQQQEIDWVEEKDGNLAAYEIKWNAKKKVKIPSAWANAYPEAKFESINPENYLSWISKNKL